MNVKLLSSFVSYISGSSSAVLYTDSTVKDGFTSPVMTSYITPLHSSDPPVSLSSATQLFQTRSMFLETTEHVYRKQNQL